MTRLSEYLLPTEKQAPADAEAISHKLMVRAGLIRQIGAGMWSWLPAGWRVHQRAVQIIREEMDAIGGQELLMPVLQPAEPWRKSGRYGIEELFKLQDRKGSELVLAMTHEEAVTTHVAHTVRSYRDLPLILYHFQVKERDELRPRAGVLRTREFIMKDAYSFDRDVEGLEERYQLHVGAYDRIMERTGLEWYRVQADVGMMGGLGAHEYMAPCPAGENEVALAGSGGSQYAANIEVAVAEPQPVELPPAPPSPKAVSTPGLSTVEEVAGALGLSQGALLKAYPVVLEGDGRMILVLLRGDHRVNEIKLAGVLGERSRPAHPQEIATQLGPPGFIGPVGLDGRMEILLDQGALPPGASVPPSAGGQGGERAYVTGANRPDAHLRGVVPGRDFPFRAVDVRTVCAGDTVGGHPVYDRARDRDWQHLQARHALLRAARCALPRRVRSRAADLDGLLRDRARAYRGCRRRAVRRRARHLLAACARAIRRAPRRGRQGRRSGARGRGGALRDAACRWGRGALRRSRCRAR